ncbi:hypothetical protein CE91St41_38710 [Oscillospiraceae bacterium]|nr:hypothetical protein CE91St40_38690 [Oscillospiraceae bacterium]BDF76982.1 hypothetical protein CE91St41_38710 [Oscillospiraceae bacterium]
MSKIVWDKTGERFYETGVDHAVLYPIDAEGLYNGGVAWNGITAINESPSGAEPNNLYADNIKYLVLVGAEDFGLTIEAYTYPDEWEQCDGSAEIAPGVLAGQQNRKIFGLSYRTKLGNDVDGQDHGYKLHLVYGGLASPSERGYQTVNDSPEPINPSWEVTTTPVDVPGFKPTARLIITSTKADPAKLAALETILYGSEEAEPRLPLPGEVIELLKADAVTVITAAESGDTTLFGKKVSDLQSNIVIGENAISGSLKHVTGYTEFSSKSSEQEGHYLALKFDVTPADAVTTVELVGGTKGPVTLDADKNIVLLIKSNTTQSIKVVSTKDGASVTKTYTLTGLTLEA